MASQTRFCAWSWKGRLRIAVSLAFVDAVFDAGMAAVTYVRIH
jgi:hypothetical protein